MKQRGSKNGEKITGEDEEEEEDGLEGLAKGIIYQSLGIRPRHHHKEIGKFKPRQTDRQTARYIQFNPPKLANPMYRTIQYSESVHILNDPPDSPIPVHQMTSYRKRGEGYI